jgi:hypothetical protein
MNLDLEVRHKSEDIDDVVLMDAIKAIGRRVRVVNRNYDIPYIAGYSKDGHIVFIDRDLPKSFSFLGRRYRVEPFLLTHEIVEKALLESCASIIFTPTRLRSVPSVTRSRPREPPGGSINASSKNMKSP